LLSPATATSTRTGDQALVREINRSIILNALRDRAPISRAKLATATGLNKGTVSSLIKDLLDAQFVHEIGLGKNAGGGRPAIMLELNPRAGCILGVEVSPDFISGILTDFAAKILWRCQEPLGNLARQEDILKHVVAIIRDMLTHAEHDGRRVLGLGLGVPGLQNPQSSGSRYAPYLSWRDGSLQSALERELGFPVHVDNEANLAVTGETYWGVARGYRNVLYLSAGQVLAVAVVLNNRVLSSTPDLGGDVGHMTIDVNGPECHCGNRGCWETFATESAVIRRVRGAIAAGQTSSLVETTCGNPDALRVPLVVQAARAGDPVAVDVLRETGRYLGIGLVNLINVFNPEMIVLGGRLSAVSDFLLPEINREIESRAALWSRRAPQVLTAAHGADASMMGGIAAVYQRILCQPNLSRVFV
jgi:predicted NBD/HSP70 family sugar kinase